MAPFFFNWLIICHYHGYSHSHSLFQAFRAEMVANDLNGTWGKTRGENEVRMGRELGKLGSPSPKHTSSKVINRFSTLIFSFREGYESLISTLFILQRVSDRPLAKNLWVLWLTASLIFSSLIFLSRSRIWTPGTRPWLLTLTEGKDQRITGKRVVA